MKGHPGSFGPIHHGTVQGYNYYGCRCEACTQARRDYYGHRPRAELMTAKHGTETYYQKYGCRCDACMAAAREAKRRRRERSRVPCSHGCGRLVDGINRRNPDKPPECPPCATQRIWRERRAASA